MQTIDPILPFESRHARRRKAGRAGETSPPLPHRGQSIDGVLQRRVRKEPAPPPPVQLKPSRPLEPIESKKTGLKIVRPYAKLKKNLTVSLLVGAVIIVIAIIARQPLGLLLVAGYGAVALLRRIPARVTFILALVTVVLVPVSLTLLGGRNVVTSALASYAFLLFATGVITLWRELHRPTAED